jgi:hypothetical protein
VQLLGLYIIISLAFLVYPDDAVAKSTMLMHAARSWTGF